MQFTIVPVLALLAATPALAAPFAEAEAGSTALVKDMTPRRATFNEAEGKLSIIAPFLP